jgi:hypothetical protein
LFANLCCWRGLVDTAWLLGELGDRETAQRYNEEAQSYRQAIDRAIEGSYQKDQRPPFLPLRLYATRPDEQPDYYQLFAGCLLDIEAFAPGSKHLRWITDFLEEDNRVFCLLPRFRTGSGAGGLDALYGKGYFLARLHEDAVAEVLLAFYAYLAFNMEHDTFVSRETNALYPSDLHVRSTYGVPESSDPLPCGSAVALHLLRHMLVTEERAGAGAYSGNLLLLGAAPRAWLENGKTIRVEAAPTYFGPVSLEVHSAASSGRIEARLIPPSRNPCPKIKLRLRHPAGHPFRQVLVNGQPWKDVDIARQWIQLPGTIGSCQIEARY